MNITEKQIDLSIPIGTAQLDDFQTAEVVTVAGAHGAHDTYFSFLPTILPLLIEKFSLSTAQAGMLSAISQIPNLLQPLIGLLADRKNLKMIVVLAPALSGCLITLMGIAPNYGTTALLLLLAGFSTAGFHSIAPGMVGAYSGRKVGRGMGFFMVGGELGFSVGPILVVATIGYLTLRGLPWLMTLGILASFILYFRLKRVSTIRHIENKSSLPVRQVLAELPALLVPIISVVFITGFLSANVVNYLPTFMASEGATFSLAGVSLSVVEFSATVGVLLMGLVSDRLGHRNVAIAGIVASVVFSAGFLWAHGWLQILMLVGVGLTIFIPNPAFLAMIQTRFQNNRSLVNGLYMSSSFILRSVVVVIVGYLADRYGMRPVFAWSAAASLLAVPIMLFLPNPTYSSKMGEGKSQKG
jgi:FSR family fosmidomycin resistance protein-like MFS transporter